jgi:PilZ domain
MGTEKRKSPRKEFERPALIQLNWTRSEPCLVRDISQGGARLACRMPETVPDEFRLQLSPDGAVVRQCRVVWKTNTEIGVQFLGDR